MSLIIILLLIFGVLRTIVGILGIMNFSKREKMDLLIRLGLIFILLDILILVKDPSLTTVSLLVISILYVVGAYNYKNSL